MVENEVIFNAAKTLQGNEFKLWCYFAANCDGYEFALSQKAVEDSIGMSKSTYYRAVNALKESCYLYQPDPQVNNWVFTQKPKSQNGYSQNEYNQKDTSQNETNLHSNRDKLPSKMEQTSTQSEWRNNINIINSIDSIEDASNALYDEEGNYLGKYGF